MKPQLVIAIDPGPEKSALVVFNGTGVQGATFYGPNEEILSWLKGKSNLPVRFSFGPLVIEKIACYGLPVGAEVFETVYWSGRFAEAYGAENVHRITRNEVKNHLCHSSRAKDGNVRQSLVDRFGGKEKAIGKKATPGPLYGVSGDQWAALAVAVTFWDRQVAPPEFFSQGESRV